ncbi:MAG: hypothetical protein PHX61_09805 [Alphaproteobacteria bacterium]|nr:hypothetical protein [Alphaproteobacteria bacterium]
MDKKNELISHLTTRISEAGDDGHAVSAALALQTTAELFAWIKTEKPFGIVRDTSEIRYMGKTGLLVWDYIVWNELTFVDAETKTKQSLFTSIHDDETKQKFDALVHKYGCGSGGDSTLR